MPSHTSLVPYNDQELYKQCDMSAFWAQKTGLENWLNLHVLEFIYFWENEQFYESIMCLYPFLMPLTCSKSTSTKLKECI